MKSLRSMFLPLAFVLLLTGCGQSQSQKEAEKINSSEPVSQVQESNQEESSEKKVEIDVKNPVIRNNLDKSGKFRIEYPEGVRDKHGEALKLDKYPEKIVDLSTSTLYLMSKLEVPLTAVSRTVATTKAADYYKDVQKIESGMRGVDTEAVIALEPDLVIMSGGMKEKFGSQLENLGIPVYYTSEGPTVGLVENRAETEALAEAFGGSQAREDVSKIYDEVKKVCEEYAKNHPAKKTMILFGPGTDHTMISTSKSFLGQILKSLGFENVGDSLDQKGSGIIPSSLEMLVKANPELFFLIAPPTGYDPQSLVDAYEKAKKEDPEVWEEIDAVKNNQVIALPGNYTTSRGLEMTQDILSLIDKLSAEVGK